MVAPSLSLRKELRPDGMDSSSESARLLGYPELAAGDTYKARLLIRAKIEMQKGKSTALGRTVNVPIEDNEKNQSPCGQDYSWSLRSNKEQIILPAND